MLRPRLTFPLGLSSPSSWASAWQTVIVRSTRRATCIRVRLIYDSGPANQQAHHVPLRRCSTSGLTRHADSEHAVNCSMLCQLINTSDWNVLSEVIDSLRWKYVVAHEGFAERRDHDTKGVRRQTGIRPVPPFSGGHMRTDRSTTRRIGVNSIAGTSTEHKVVFGVSFGVRCLFVTGKSLRSRFAGG